MLPCSAHGEEQLSLHQLLDEVVRRPRLPSERVREDLQFVASKANVDHAP
jgi:hypothetical protein